MHNSSEGFAEHILGHRAALLGFIRSKVGDSDLAEDILQDSLLKALRADVKVSEDGVLPWFYTIVRNAITDNYRRNAAATRRLEAFRQEQPEPVISDEDQAALCACFRQLLPTMNPDYAALIEAMDLSGATTSEMASRLNTTPENLKVKHYRARKQLQSRLEDTCRSCAVHGCLDCTCSN